MNAPKKCFTKHLFLAGIEPATFRVWGERDNRYTTETYINEDNIVGNFFDK